MKPSASNRLTKILLFTGVILATFSITVSAQYEEANIIKNLSVQAEAIVIGKVVGSESQWTQDKSSIITNVTISVEEYVKGSNQQKTIVVSHPGGEIDGVGELYSHIPSFKNDEEVLLFVKKRPDNKLIVLGGEEGKIPIQDINGKKLIGMNKPLGSVTAQIKNYIIEE